MVALRASLHRLPSPYVPPREASPAAATAPAPTPAAEHTPVIATDAVDSGSEARHSNGTRGGPALEGAGSALVEASEPARREASAQRRRRRRLRVP